MKLRDYKKDVEKDVLREIERCLFVLLNSAYKKLGINFPSRNVIDKTAKEEGEFEIVVDTTTKIVVGNFFERKIKILENNHPAAQSLRKLFKVLDYQIETRL
ncbi:MAG: hypothetical protein ABH822_02760 [Patescibacteria group bacterium]